MYRGEHSIDVVEVFEKMLEELVLQSKIRRTLDFTYEYQKSGKRIGRLLSKQEQYEVLLSLDSQGYISLGRDVFSERDDEYIVGIEPNVLEKFREKYLRLRQLRQLKPR